MVTVIIIKSSLINWRRFLREQHVSGGIEAFFAEWLRSCPSKDTVSASNSVAHKDIAIVPVVTAFANVTKS